MAKYIGTLHSDYRPLQGQSHRSSWGDLAVRAMGSSANMTLHVEGGGDGITFDIMKDVSGGTDPVVLPNAHDGSAFKASDGDRYYIANPKNASADFNVTFDS
jgi:hypothetical protein